MYSRLLQVDQNTAKSFFLFGPRGTDAHIRSNDLNSLLAFQTDYPEAHLYLLHGGTETTYEAGITLMPISKALKILPQLFSKEI